jgi:hypothetical protein
MCRTRGKLTTTSWLPLFALLATVLVFPSSKALAQGSACQASGSIPMFPAAGNTCGTGVLGGGSLDILVTFTNTSSTVPPGTNVAATLTGTISVGLPAGDVANVGFGGNVNGCVSHVAGVASCTAGAGVVNINMTAGGVPLAAGATFVTIATVRVTTNSPAAAGCNVRALSASLPAPDLVTNDPANCEPQVTGGAQGSSNYRQVECLSPTTCPGADGTCGNRTCVANACGMSFQPATTQCRAAADLCDTPASCTGSSVTCPANGFKSSTTQCRAAVDGCDNPASCTGSSAVCPPNGFKSSTTQCRAAVDGCDNPASCTGTSAVCPPNGFKSATTQCRAAADLCDTAASCTGSSATCPPNGFKPATTQCNAALCESCTGNSASCPTANLCVPEACRTPGYWAQHAGEEKDCATNQTSNVIASLGGINPHLTICGQPIIPFLGAGNTGVGHKDSPIEALCMPNGGDFRSQVVFQLTAAALNCVANGHAANCSNDPLFGATFAACDSGAVCAPTTDSNKAAQDACVNALDCLNNGGHPATDSSGNFLCASGTCSDNSKPCTESNLSNCATPGTATCNPGPNCHTNNFPNFPDSCAGSQKACQDANKNACDIFSTPSASCLLP